MSYQDLLLIEIKHTPEKFLPALFEIVRLFRASVATTAETSLQPPAELQGNILYYHDPFEPAAPIEDWEVLR